MSKKEEIVHIIDHEKTFFCDFIVNCIIALGGEVELKSMDEDDVGYYLSKGLPGINEEPCFLVIMYATNPEVIVEYAKRKQGHYPLVIVSLVEEKIVKKNSFANITILGEKYVVGLVKQFPGLWWNFISLCAPTPELEINAERQTISFTHYPLAVMRTGPVELNCKYVDQLSKGNQTLFEKELKNSKKISIIIGNGVSIPFGSDLWDNVSNYLFDFLSPKYVDDSNSVRKAIGNTTYSCTSISKSMIDKKRYYQALHSCIYRKYEETMHVRGTLIHEIVKSKIKKPGLNLITYNYDNYVELEYKKQTGSLLKPVTSSKKDRNTREPKIKHVHGFLPFGAPSKHAGIVLTQEEYYSAYSGKTWVVKTQKDALNGVCLFVGSSMSDQFQMSIIEKVRKSNESNPAFSKSKWKCYCLMCLKGLSCKDIVTVYNYYIRKGIYLIFVNDYSELPLRYSEMFK